MPDWETRRKAKQETGGVRLQEATPGLNAVAEVLSAGGMPGMLRSWSISA
jgi:hypothetical protein